MIIKKNMGVPKFRAEEYHPKTKKYCLCIPIINEGERIHLELQRGLTHKIHNLVDIIICDGGSTDNSTSAKKLKKLKVNALLTKDDIGKQGAQLRMGFWWALKRGYKGIITIDGNNKDSIESIPRFIKKLESGFDFIQGSRYLPGGGAVNTPFLRHFAVKHIHAPAISLTAGYTFTDTTNGYRGYSSKYLLHPSVKPFRDVFMTYELLAYLSVRASQLGLKVCEVPVVRTYPRGEKVPTKINFYGMIGLIKILIKTALGLYAP